MKIREIRAVGLRGETPEGGWSNKIESEDCVHTLVAVHTDEGAVGLGSVFTSEELVKAALKVLQPLFRGEEAMDTELGRLLGSREPDTLENTTIIYLGDNGSPAQVAGPRNKGTLYQGGVHVPLTITGAGVVNSGEVEALVDVETVTPVAAPIDSVSLVPYLEDPDRDASEPHELQLVLDPEFL